MFTLKDLTGTYDATATISGDYVLENKQSIIDNITAQITAQGGAVEEKEGNLYVIGGTQFFRLPKMPRQRTGRITFRSKDYVFSYDGKQSYGDKPKAAFITETGFYMIMFDGNRIDYTLGKKHA